MEYITLKNSNLKVSRICMGGCPMGGYGWGEVQEEKLVEAVNVAIDTGVNFFDTADTYGLGQSEKTLGQALGEKRKNAIIATKFGVRVENGKTFYDNSREWINQAVDASLKRLGTDYIDLYQVHYRDGITPIEDVIDELNNLKQVGKIRYFGLANVYEKDFNELKTHAGEFVSFQNEFSLACRKYENDIQLLSKKIQMSPFTWGSLGQGILSGKYDKTVVFEKNDRRSRDVYVNFHGEKLLKNLEIVEIMKEIESETHKPLSAIALRWILDYLKESVVLVGVKSADQILSNIEAVDWHLSEDAMDRLNQISLS